MVNRVRFFNAFSSRTVGLLRGKAQQHAADKSTQDDQRRPAWQRRALMSARDGARRPRPKMRFSTRGSCDFAQDDKVQSAWILRLRAG